MLDANNIGFISAWNVAPAFISHFRCCVLKSLRQVVGVSFLASSPFFNGENSSSRKTSHIAKFLKIKN
jgi:hypothetical protein